MTQGQVQLGKNGITENFMITLMNHFSKNQNVRIIVLKGAGRERGKVKEYSKEILERLGKRYTAKVVGFTIFLKRWRKEVR